MEAQAGGYQVQCAIAELHIPPRGCMGAMNVTDSDLRVAVAEPTAARASCVGGGRTSGRTSFVPYPDPGCQAQGARRCAPADNRTGDAGYGRHQRAGGQAGHRACAGPAEESSQDCHPAPSLATQLVDMLAPRPRAAAAGRGFHVEYGFERVKPEVDSRIRSALVGRDAVNPAFDLELDAPRNRRELP
jgi:hypothetical protein